MNKKKIKHTALCENALPYDIKTTINKQILCRFQKKCFQRSKNWNTPFYLQMFCVLSGRSFSWNTPVFTRLTSREHANFFGCHFFHTHVLPHYSKTQLLRYCGKRSFLGVAKSWKVTLDRVPWFGRHVENLGDVIIYPVLVVARTVQTELERENSASCHMRCCSRVGHDLRAIFMLWLGWHRFRFHLAQCLRGLQSLKRYWPYLIPFRRCISSGKPE